MDKFKTVLNIANKQANLGFGLVALLTAGGEQIFSSAVFSCPCNQLNFLYGVVFLLVPALALLLLGFMLSKRTWKLMTGLCRRGVSRRHFHKRLAAGCMVLSQIGTTALVAPFSWIAVALLNGKYYECAMTGTGMGAYSRNLCGDDNQEQCQRELHRFPCGKAGSALQAVREDVMLTLRAQSQIIGWLLIASIMLSNLLLTCVARCTSPISYLQLKFWKVYAQEESTQLDSHTSRHAKEMAERNVRCFFSRTRPEELITPSNHDWEKISALYKFSTKDHYYSTLHQCVENYQETDSGVMRLASLKISEATDENPAVLHFVDDGRLNL